LEDWDRSEDTIKIDLRGKVEEGLVWIRLALDRDQWWSVIMVINLQVPYKKGDLVNGTENSTKIFSYVIRS
jgi:hypothetical protein